MSLFDKFNYQNKRVLVVGGATGMGAAAAELARDAGAEVIVMDRGEITLDGVRTLYVDMSEKESITRRWWNAAENWMPCLVAQGLPMVLRVSNASTLSATAI